MKVLEQAEALQLTLMCHSLVPFLLYSTGVIYNSDLAAFLKLYLF